MGKVQAIREGVHDGKGLGPFLGRSLSCCQFDPQGVECFLTSWVASPVKNIMNLATKFRHVRTPGELVALTEINVPDRVASSINSF